MVTTTFFAGYGNVAQQRSIKLRFYIFNGTVTSSTGGCAIGNATD
jgi:hypothetical protein